MKIALAAFCASFAIFGAACAFAPAPGGTPPLAPGSTWDSSDYNAPKYVKDTRITSFKVAFKREAGIYMKRQGGGWVEDVEKNIRRPNGFYRFAAEREDGKAKITAEFSKSEKYEYSAPLSALDELHAACMANDLPKINGFSKSNSALGTYVRVDVQYASGETIRAFGEGGISCSPPVDLGFTIDTFRALTERYVPKSKRPNWPDYEKLKRQPAMWR